MKFYLSSYKIGNNPESLASLFDINRKVAVITNALDCYTDILKRQNSERIQIELLNQLGLKAELLDLRNYFGKNKELEEKLKEFGGVWVHGGNTFVLRVAYNLSSFDNIISSYHKDTSKSDFVYAGFSSGCCVLQESLKDIDIIDEPSMTKDAYGKEPIWEGVGVLNFALVPHFESDHPESERAGLTADYYKKNNIKYRTLKDGEVIILNN